jgi:pimeloyl-ACP methyl ester carboxylesterase
MSPSTHPSLAKIPVLMAHGWGGSFEATFAPYGWREAFAAQGRDVIGIDLPGHGHARPASHDPQSYSDLAGVLSERLPAGALDAVGFSLGSKLLLELECRLPGRFRRLVLGGVGANAFAPERGTEPVAAALESGEIENAPEPVKMMVRYAQLSGSDPRALAAVVRRPANPIHNAERLAHVAAQTLLINGAEDKGVAPVDALASVIPGSTSLLIPNVGHIDLPGHEEFRSAAIAFLTKP